MMSGCGYHASSELQQSNLDGMHELLSVLVASSVRYWRMKLMRLMSTYAALHVLMMCGFNERSLSKMKPRLRATSATQYRYCKDSFYVGAAGPCWQKRRF